MPKKRANAVPTGVAVEAKKKIGRPRAVISQAELERLLLSGLTSRAASEALKVSHKTVQTRIAEARAEHGPSWGKPITVAPTAPRGRPPADPNDIGATREAALEALAEVVADPFHRDRVQAAKALLEHVKPAAPVAAEAPIAGLLEAVLAATRDAEERPPVPGLSIVG